MDSEMQLAYKNLATAQIQLAALEASIRTLLDTLKALTGRAKSMASMLNSLGYAIYYNDAYPLINAARAAISEAKP